MMKTSVQKDVDSVNSVNQHRPVEKISVVDVDLENLSRVFYLGRGWCSTFVVYCIFKLVDVDQ